MEHFINKLSIKNFKSIQSLDLKTERINLFIGKPNVGKSNILEAVSLFGISNIAGNVKDLSSVIRYEIPSDLFYDQDMSNPITIESNVKLATIDWVKGARNCSLELKNKEHPSKSNPNSNYNFSIQHDGHYAHQGSDKSPVRKYQFQLKAVIDETKGDGVTLNCPFGNNLFEVLQSNKVIRKEIANYFKEYNLDFVLDFTSRKFEIQKRVDGLVYKTPYGLVADTLQRMIFHLAAIESNKENILLFEEPENHSFPPYIRDLAQRIVNSASNQFFITTHSPYLFNTITQNAKKGEVAIFITTYADHETKVKRLSEDEIERLMDYGIDIFFNLNQFVDD